MIHRILCWICGIQPMNEPLTSPDTTDARLDRIAAELIRRNGLAEYRCEFIDERNELLSDLVSHERLSDEQAAYLRERLSDLLPPSIEQTERNLELLFPGGVPANVRRAVRRSA